MTDLAPQTGPTHGFGLYVHWPYCAHICPYCDFNVYAAKSREAAPLVTAICTDITTHRALLPDHPVLGSIFLGGGTPSLLQPAEMAQIIKTASDAFGLTETCEITLEANPNDVLKADLAGWRTAGVNRLSIGVQSLDDEALKFLGRDHDARAGKRAVESALAIFPSVSVDLIYALPDQTSEIWRAELDAMLRLGAQHLSLYELTIEARTAFGKAATRGTLIPMPDDAQAELYEITDEVTLGAGLTAYEISNHAISTAHQSQHNLTYWRSGDWIGVGPGAHGRLTIDGKRIATEAARRPADYIAASAPTHETLTPYQTAQEMLAMGLRPSEGIELSRIETLSGAPLDKEKLETLARDGFITAKDGRIALTPKGRLLADYIAGQLAP